jgi:hypothetical protein
MRSPVTAAAAKSVRLCSRSDTPRNNRLILDVGGKKTMPKKKIRSLSIDPQLEDTVIKHAELRSQSVSLFICNWLQQYPFHDTNVIPVVIDVPRGIADDRQKLEEFFQKKSHDIVEAFGAK